MRVWGEGAEKEQQMRELNSAEYAHLTRYVCDFITAPGFRYPLQARTSEFRVCSSSELLRGWVEALREEMSRFGGAGHCGALRRTRRC